MALVRKPFCTNFPSKGRISNKCISWKYVCGDFQPRTLCDAWFLRSKCSFGHKTTWEDRLLGGLENPPCHKIKSDSLEPQRRALISWTWTDDIRVQPYLGIEKNDALQYGEWGFCLICDLLFENRCKRVFKPMPPDIFFSLIYIPTPTGIWYFFSHPTHKDSEKNITFLFFNCFKTKNKTTFGFFSPWAYFSNLIHIQKIWFWLDMGLFSFNLKLWCNYWRLVFGFYIFISIIW